MALYSAHDIETDDAGELQFENGDLKIASVKRSHLQALNWVVMTNRTDSPTPDAVANLVAFLGVMNRPSTHRAMEGHVRQAVFFQQLFNVDDLLVSVTPVSRDACAMNITMRGIFDEDVEEDAEDPISGYQVLGYYFPFDNATPEKVTD